MNSILYDEQNTILFPEDLRVKQLIDEVKILRSNLNSLSEIKLENNAQSGILEQLLEFCLENPNQEIDEIEFLQRFTQRINRTHFQSHTDVNFQQTKQTQFILQDFPQTIVSLREEPGTRLSQYMKNQEPEAKSSIIKVKKNKNIKQKYSKLDPIDQAFKASESEIKQLKIIDKNHCLIIDLQNRLYLYSIGRGYIIQEFNQNSEQIEEFTYGNNTLSYLVNDRYFQYQFEEQRFNLFRTLQLDEFYQYLESTNGIYYVSKEQNFYKDEKLITKLDSTVISIRMWNSLVIVQFLDSLLIYDEISEQLTTLEIYDNILQMSVGQNVYICTQSRECFKLNDDYSIKRLQFTASHIHQLDNQFKVILDNNTTDYRHNRVALYKDETLITEIHSIAPRYCDVNDQNLYVGDEMGWIQQSEL